MWDLWWTKWRWGRFYPSTSVFPVNLHSANFSTITLTYHPGWYNRPLVAAVPKVPQNELKKKTRPRKVGCIRNFRTLLSILFPLPNKGYPVTPGMNLFLWASMSKERLGGLGLAGYGQGFSTEFLCELRKKEERAMKKTSLI
jgi:hypothetical protein